MQTIKEFDAQFPTDEACKAYLAAKRWPQGVRCPRCGAREKVYALKARPFHWLCKNTDCGGRNGYRFSVLTHTIFQDTKVPLSLWFKVGYLMMTSKKGISALQVHRVMFGEDSGSAYRTSWYMCQRWRPAMRGDAFKLDGTVEIDETYVGGKDRNRHRSKRRTPEAKRGGFRGGKVGVMGAIARKGNVVCQVIERMDYLTTEALRPSDHQRERVAGRLRRQQAVRVHLLRPEGEAGEPEPLPRRVRARSTPRTWMPSGRC